MSSRVADLLIAQGQNAAAAAEARGRLWGQAVDNISQIPGQVIAGQQQAKTAEMQRQELQQRMALQQQQLGSEQTATARQSAVDQILGAGVVKSDGTVDTDKIQQLATSAGHPELVPDLIDRANKWNASAVDLNEKRTKAQEAQLSLAAAAADQLGVNAKDLKPDDPAAFSVFVAHQVQLGTLPKDQGDALIEQAHQDPSVIAPTVQGWVSKSKTLQQMRMSGIKDVPEGGSLVDLNAAGGPKSIVQGAPKPPTGPELDAAAEKIYAKKESGATLTAEETASLKAYEDRKRVVSDPAALAATQRLASSQAAAVASEGRKQDFAQLQAARADIEKNVQTPYLTAQNSANTLRDVVTAAQNGNKVAGSLQSLETTMAAIRAQGLNRINRTETDMAGNAGSLFDRIEGWVGKAAEGQPVPADVQKDMLAFSDILENAAYKKYLAGHKASTDLYGVTDKLKPTVPAPVASQAAPAPKEGDTAPITDPGYPAGAMKTFTNGKWIRTK